MTLLMIQFFLELSTSSLLNLWHLIDVENTHILFIRRQTPQADSLSTLVLMMQHCMLIYVLPIK